MGHGQKNKNRGEAIQRNAARVGALAEKLKEMGLLAKKLDAEQKEEINLIVAEMESMSGDIVTLRSDLDATLTEVNRRLDLLERNMWRKFMDKMKDVVKRGDPAKPANRAIQLDIHSTRHEAHSRIKKTDQKGKEVKDGGTESSDS